MKKKHLFTCFVMVVLLVISGINIYSKTEKEVPKSTPRISKYLYKNVDSVSGFSFANEALPVDNVPANRKLQNILARHNFKYVGSNLLHIKAEKIFPVIEPILAAYGIPDDFKYVPLVEAGFNEGLSPKGAKGLWQFLPQTARVYGLKVGKGVDERTDLKKATVAACKYIKELHTQFNSWTLAAAAYNNGEIKLSKAIYAQSEDNYFRMHLNQETGLYVYDLIAVKAIISYPKRYGYRSYVKLAPADLMAFN